MQSDNILHSCLGVSLGSFAGGEVEKPLAEKDEALSFIFCNQARLQKSGAGETLLFSSERRLTD